MTNEHLKDPLPTSSNQHQSPLPEGFGIDSMNWTSNQEPVPEVTRWWHPFAKPWLALREGRNPVDLQQEPVTDLPFWYIKDYKLVRYWLQCFEALKAGSGNVNLSDDLIQEWNKWTKGNPIMVYEEILRELWKQMQSKVH